MANPMNDKISLSLPVKISYTAIQEYLRGELAGMKLKKDSGRAVAEILDLSITRSTQEGFDILAQVDIRILTAVFKNREGKLLVDISLDFNKKTQEVWVRDFQVDVKTKSWLVNNTLETVVNAFLYGRLKERMRFDFRDLVKEKLSELNIKLEAPQEASEGIFLSGFVEDFQVVDLFPGKKVMLAFVQINARALIDIRKISF